jgi:hypothetical protein
MPRWYKTDITEEKKMITGNTDNANWNPNVDEYDGFARFPKSISAP